jgi:hypothetical protein
MDLQGHLPGDPLEYLLKGKVRHRQVSNLIIFDVD